MRSEDILNRADAALSRVNKSYRASQQADGADRAASNKPFVNRWIQAGILVAGLIAIITFLNAPFTVFMVAIVIAGLGFVVSRMRPTKAGKTVAQDLPKQDLTSLPLKAELWLASQRRLLPPAAQSIVDSICSRMKLLASQVGGLNDDDPIGHDIRRLLAEELPELVNDYYRIPAALRKSANNGFMPDKQLTQGLITIDSRLEQINDLLAAVPVTRLATQARYLDMKYPETLD